MNLKLPNNTMDDLMTLSKTKGVAPQSLIIEALEIYLIHDKNKKEDYSNEITGEVLQV